MFGLFKKKKADINADFIDKAAAMMRLQIMLCRFEPEFVPALDKDIVRGYFVGWFDSCLQRLGVSIADDETFFHLMLRAHEILLPMYVDDIRQYTFTSMRRQDALAFQKGMQVGGSEFLEVLGSVRKPLAFAQYIHEGRGPLAG